MKLMNVVLIASSLILPSLTVSADVIENFEQQAVQIDRVPELDQPEEQILSSDAEEMVTSSSQKIDPIAPPQAEMPITDVNTKQNQLTQKEEKAKLKTFYKMEAKKKKLAEEKALALKKAKAKKSLAALKLKKQRLQRFNDISDMKVSMKRAPSKSPIKRKIASVSSSPRLPRVLPAKKIR